MRATFGKFELLTRLARGGMAEIFVARQRGDGGFQRLVVVKRILPHLSDEPRFVEMFLEEARIAALLDHPNVIPIYDVDREGDSYYIAMPYVAGLPLVKVMAESSARGFGLPLEVTCNVMAQALAGLHYAHERVGLDGLPLSLVHRDVSPSNLLVSEQGRVLLLDFGIAKARGAAQRLTETGSLKGKLSYMSPEQGAGEPLDRRSDLFSLGIIFFEMAVGRRLFARKTDFLTAKAISEEEVPDPEASGVPGPIAAVIRRALARDRDARFATARAMREAVIAASAELDLDDPTAGVATFLHGRLGDLLAQRRDEIQAAVDGHGAAMTLEQREAPTFADVGSRSTRGSKVRRKRRPLVIAAAVMSLVAAASVVAAVIVLRMPNGPPLRFAAAPYLPRAQMQRDLGPLMSYLERRLERPVKLVLPDTYDRTIQLLLRGEVDVANLPPYAYLRAVRMARAKKRGDARALVTVVAGGATSYEGYLVVRREDPASKLLQLRGRRVCYVDRASTSGYLIARVLVRRSGFDPDRFFSSAQFSGNHHQALRDLLAKRCDVATVYAGAYRSADAEGIAVGQTRIVAITPPLPYDVIAPAPGLRADVRHAVRQALLGFSPKRELSRARLGPSIPITSFTPTREHDFDELRRELAATREQARQ
ncbi:MAG: phosphate/phosphite/phosphonate ABC transporter substrate-binding protein [Myxococcales bacterium]|nr:phosphate/phosphite/phosphonate ABC transporter substrate-binding protein [Myxococcales bacterium]